MTPADPIAPREEARRLLLAGQGGRARLLLKGVLAGQPDDVEGWNDLAVTFMAEGLWEAARGSLERGLGIMPAHRQALLNRAETGLQAGAEGPAPRRLVALEPQSAEAVAVLADTALGRGPGSAASWYRAALALDGSSPRLWANLAALEAEQKNWSRAQSAAAMAACYEPTAERLIAVARAVRPGGPRATAWLRRAIAAYPGYGMALLELGVDLHHDLAEAAARWYRRSLACKGAEAAAWSNLGNAQGELGELQGAARSYRRALALAPTLAEAHYNFSLALLSLGRWNEGWREHEWRWSCAGYPSLPSRSTARRWPGRASPRAETVLLTAEQGFGDSIQFFRYVRRAAETTAARIVLECDEALVRLFAGSEPRIQVRDRDGEPPPHDRHAYLMSLPRLLGIPDDDGAAAIPYLAAEPWSLPSLDKLNVGLAWAGSPKHRRDATRSCRLDDLLPLLEIPGIAWHSLQLGARADDISRLGADGVVERHDRRIGDFADTAGLVAALDAVVCVDTAVAHLAGALGKPVGVLLSTPPDWRWPRSGSRTRWYPTMSLFRSHSDRPWTEATGAARTWLSGRASRRADKP